MKKLLFSAIAVLVSIVPVAAQSLIVDNPANRSFLSLRAGIDITSTSEDYNDEYNNGFGVNFGVAYNIPLWKNLYFEPGLLVFYDTIGDNIAVAADEPYTLSCSIRNMGFRIPLLASYHFDLTDEFTVAPFTGPQINYSFMAKHHGLGDSTYNEIGGDSMFGSGGFKHLDGQWIFGLNFSFKHLYIACSGGVGMNNVFDKRVSVTTTNPTTGPTTVQVWHQKFRRNTFTITLGYNF